MKSHFSFNQGVAAACAVAGATTMLNGRCSAQTVVASDYATNAAYAAGWAPGQNGGFGFGPWSMDNTSTNNLIQAAIDRTSSFDPFGVAWTLYNPEGTAPSPANSPGGQCVNPPLSTDISRAGRACAPLQPGETFTAIVANPTCRTFYRGYTIRLVTGSDNTSYGNASSQIAVGTFEYFSYGRWYTTESYSTGRTSLFDTDTTAGMELDVTMTSTNGYHLVMTPLANPSLAYSEDGTLATNGLVNWIEFEMYNTDSDFYPAVAPCGPDPTDFYIKSMTISGPVLKIELLDTNAILTWPTNAFNLTLQSTTNLGVGAVWNHVLPPASVVNGQNVVTNPAVGVHQFYRLSNLP